jgi:hypothetical protein
MAKLAASVVSAGGLTAPERDAMFALMRASYDGLRREAFDADLAEKQWVILLADPADGRVRGFSTQTTMETTAAGSQVRALFSGDTIIERGAWGALALERAWMGLAIGLAEADPARRWFWFLISKGYRTFRYLPVYFRRYYPSPDVPTPPLEREALDRLAGARFGDAWNPGSGVIRHPGDYRLRPGVGDIGDRELRDPRVAFFQRRNPGWAAGDELACLAELSRANLRPAGERLLRGGGGA